MLNSQSDIHPQNSPTRKWKYVRKDQILFPNEATLEKNTKRLQ